MDEPAPLPKRKTPKQRAREFMEKKGIKRWMEIAQYSKSPIAVNQALQALAKLAELDRGDLGVQAHQVKLIPIENEQGNIVRMKEA